MFLHVKQRPHPTPTLQGESCVNLIISKTIGKTKQNNQRGQGQNHQKPLGTKTIFEPMTLFGDKGPKVVFCFVAWFSQWF